MLHMIKIQICQWVMLWKNFQNYYGKSQGIKELVKKQIGGGQVEILDLTAWIFLYLKKQGVNKTWVCFEPVAQIDWKCLLNTWHHSWWSNVCKGHRLAPSIVNQWNGQTGEY